MSAAQEILTPKEAANYTRYSEQTLARMRVAGGGPSYIQANKGGAVRYRLADLEDWLESKIIGSTSQAA